MDLAKAIRDRRHRALLARACAGHEASLRALYRTLYDPVAGYVGRRIEISEDAEDVVAKVFERFVMGLDRYDPERGSVWTWVMTMARRAVIDHWRAGPSASRLLTEPIDQLADVLAADTSDPLGRLIDDEDARLLHGLLREEPAEVREIFALHFGEGLRYREIAEVLDQSEAAVKQRFSRTMRRLRRQGQQDPKGGEHESMALARAQSAEGPARS